MKIKIDNLEVIVGYFKTMDSRMYIILCEDEALIIDPCIDKEALNELSSSIKKITVLLTHEHYDHISGVEWLKSHYNCHIICTEQCNLAIQDSKLNLANFFDVHFDEKKENYSIEEYNNWREDYNCKADEIFLGTKMFVWKNNAITLKEAPGHSPGGMLIFFNKNILFTGDNLVNGNKVITRTFRGSKKLYKEITQPMLRKLNDNIWIFPGHGEIEKFGNLKNYIEV